MKAWLFFILTPFFLNADIMWNADLKKPFALTINIHPESVSLGENLYIDVDFQHPSAYEFDTESLMDHFMWLANPLSQQWSLVDTKISVSSIKEGVSGGQLNVTLLPLSLGRLELSFLIATFNPKNKGVSPQEVVTPIFTFDILSSSQTTTLSLAPLIPLEPQFPFGLTLSNSRLWADNLQELEKAKMQIRHDLDTRAFPWLILAFLLGCAGTGWFLFLMRDRWPERKVKIVEKPSLKQKIDQEVKALEEVPYHQEIASLYYGRLSAILLDAVASRSTVSIHGLTTIELERAMKEHSSLSAVDLEEAFSLLREVDQVKFAGVKPSLVEAEKIFQHIRQFILKIA